MYNAYVNDLFVLLLEKAKFKKNLIKKKIKSDLLTFFKDPMFLPDSGKAILYK